MMVWKPENFKVTKQKTQCLMLNCTDHRAPSFIWLNSLQMQQEYLKHFKCSWLHSVYFGVVSVVCTNGGCAHRPMKVQGTTVDQGRNHLELHTAMRGIIVVMVTGYCLSKLKILFDEITPSPPCTSFANVKGGASLQQIYPCRNARGIWLFLYMKT